MSLLNPEIFLLKYFKTKIGGWTSKQLLPTKDGRSIRFKFHFHPSKNGKFQSKHRQSMKAKLWLCENWSTDHLICTLAFLCFAGFKTRPGTTKSIQFGSFRHCVKRTAIGWSIIRFRGAFLSVCMDTSQAYIKIKLVSSMKWSRKVVSIPRCDYYSRIECRRFLWLNFDPLFATADALLIIHGTLGQNKWKLVMIHLALIFASHSLHEFIPLCHLHFGLAISWAPSDSRIKVYI